MLSAVRQAQSLGATVYDHTRVLSVEPDGNGVLVRTDGGARRYAQAVVAPGPWARELLGPALDLVLPRRLVQAWYAPIDIAQYRAEVFPVFERVGDVKAYGFPTVDGATVKVGIYTTGHPIVYDLDQPPRTVSVALARYFRDTVATYLPGLHPDPVTIATGIEGYTTDGLAAARHPAGQPAVDHGVRILRLRLQVRIGHRGHDCRPGHRRSHRAGRRLPVPQPTLGGLAGRPSHACLIGSVGLRAQA